MTSVILKASEKKYSTDCLRLNNSKIALRFINESLRVSDTERGEPQKIFGCRGEGHGQLRVTMITPPPTPARLVKLKKEEHRFSIYLFILLFNYIVLITIIWQNLDGREERAYAP